MLKNMNRNRMSCVAVYLLLAILVLFEPAQAALVGFNFQSNGDDGSTAVGFVEWDDTVASAIKADLLEGFEGTTQFNWTISGGINDGTRATLEELDHLLWESWTNNMADDFNFFAIGERFKATFFFQTTDTINDVIYTHHNFTPVVVPIPTAILMFAPALLGLFGFVQNRQKNTQ